MRSWFSDTWAEVHVGELGRDSITRAGTNNPNCSVERACLIVVVGDAAATVVPGNSLGLVIPELEGAGERCCSAGVCGCEGYALILQGCGAGYGERGDQKGRDGGGEGDGVGEGDEPGARYLQQYCVALDYRDVLDQAKVAGWRAEEDDGVLA